MKLSAVCLFCGSSSGGRSDYVEAARAVGIGFAVRGIRLIYGGGSVGLMGAAADACLAAGGEVTGVITQRLLGLELGHCGITKLEVVETMHQRKARMAELSDGFVCLPGGMGTLEELAEVLSLAQLQLHAKPCGVLNVAGFYDPLRNFLQHMVAEHFLLQDHSEILLCESTVEELLDKMGHHQPMTTVKWHQPVAGPKS